MLCHISSSEAMEQNMPKDDTANRSSVDFRIQKTQVLFKWGVYRFKYDFLYLVEILNLEWKSKNSVSILFRIAL